MKVRWRGGRARVAGLVGGEGRAMALELVCGLFRPRVSLGPLAKAGTALLRSLSVTRSRIALLLTTWRLVRRALLGEVLVTMLR